MLHAISLLSPTTSPLLDPSFKGSLPLESAASSMSSSSSASKVMSSWTPYPWSPFVHALNSLNSSQQQHQQQESSVAAHAETASVLHPTPSSLSPSSLFAAASSFLSFTPEPLTTTLATTDHYLTLEDVPGAAIDDTSDMLEEFVGFLKPAIGSAHSSLHQTSSSTLTDESLIDSSSSFLAVSIVEALAIALPALIIMLFTIIGNALVIAAVFTYRPLKQSQNMYLVSLAVADITVAMFVMPFNVIYSIRGKWDFGLDTCKAWLTFDILCCTASILNLCAIALDRYQAIHDPINYAQKRTLRRVLIGIFLAWIISALISIPPLLGWNDWPETFDSSSPCALTSEKGFVVYSSSGSFFIPLIIMSIVYVKIFLATRRRLRARTKSAPAPTTTMSNTKSASNLWNTRRDGSIDHSDPREEDGREMHQLRLQQALPLKKKKNSSSASRSRTAAAASFMGTITSRLDTSSSSKTSPEAVTWTPAVLAVAPSSCSSSSTSAAHQQSSGLTAAAAAAAVVREGCSIDHCPVSSVRIAIEKNSSSISSSQDDFTLVMPPDLNRDPEINGTTDEPKTKINGSERSSHLTGSVRRLRSCSTPQPPASGDSSSSRRDSSDDAATTVADGQLRHDNGSADVNQSEGEGEEGDERRSRRTGRRGSGGEGWNHSCRSRSGNQITDSGGYTEIEIEDERESSHHKRIIDPAFRTNHKEGEDDEEEEEDDEEERKSEMLSIEPDDAADAAKVAASLTATITTVAAVAASAESCIYFDRTDHEDEGPEDGKGMIRMMDQTVTRLSVPSKNSAFKDGTRKSSSSSSGTTPSASSAPSLLHPNAIRNQSNLENNSLQLQQRNSNKRVMHSGDSEAGGGDANSAPTGRPGAAGTTPATESGNSSRFKLKVEYESSCGSSGPTIDPVSTGTNAGSASVAQVWEEKQRISLSRERKAARVLGIVMGVFVACWLPFFLMYVILPFAEQGIPRWLENLITWLGYINSALNPIIYTIFNLDFRRAFLKMLTCDRR